MLTYCVLTYCVLTYCVLTYCVLTYCVGSPAALAMLANVAPHVKQWSPACASLLPQMLAALAQPRVLFADPSHPDHLLAILEVITLTHLLPDLT